MQRCLSLIISITAKLDMPISKYVCFLFTVFFIFFYFRGPLMPTILYNTIGIMLVYEGKIKLRLFSHASTSLFSRSYMLFHFNSVQQLTQFKFSIVVLPVRIN